MGAAVSMKRSRRLQITPAVRGDTVCLRVAGELDLATTGELTTALTEAERSNPHVVILDLSEVDFADATALRVFVAASRRAHLRDRRFVLASPSQVLRRMLSLTALDRNLEVVA
jgi:anti-sigma B factor antagonist